VGFKYTKPPAIPWCLSAPITGCCIKPKMRSANDQQDKNPTSTPSTEKMIRLRNSSRCASRDIERTSRTSNEAASAMEGLASQGFAWGAAVYGAGGPLVRLPRKRPVCFIHQIERAFVRDQRKLFTVCKTVRYDNHCSQPGQSVGH
jgi:hypothetical protein